MCKEVLDSFGLSVPCFGMVKDDRHRTRALVAPDGREFGISATPALFALIGRMQEEVHRFAIEYNRKLGGKKVIYTNDPTRQSASVAMYDAEGIDVVVMDALIDLNFLSFMEYSSGVEGLTFARVDADSQTFQKEMTEDEKKQSEEDEKKLADVLHKATGKEDLTVKLASLKDESLPAMLTQEEQGRRFSEMSRIYGQNFKLPETHTLVLNAANPVVKSLISGEADEETRGLIAAQLYDLARMSTRPLEKEEVTAFLSRSNKLLELLSKR